MLNIKVHLRIITIIIVTRWYYHRHQPVRLNCVKMKMYMVRVKMSVSNIEILKMTVFKDVEVTEVMGHGRCMMPFIFKKLLS